MDAIRAKAVELAPEVLNPVFAEKPAVTFRVRARRSFKKFPFRSQEIEIDLVSAIAKPFGDDRFRIDLKHAEYTLGVEVRDEFALLYWDEFKAPGGLPGRQQSARADAAFRRHRFSGRGLDDHEARLPD